MDIRDAVAEAILRDVLENPWNYPHDLMKPAREFQTALDRVAYKGYGYVALYFERNAFIRALKEHGISVPDDPSEQKRGDNGNDSPDAREFK